MVWNSGKIAWLIILLTGVMAISQAAEVGEVSRLRGRVDVTRSAEPARELRLGDAVHVQDILRTKSGALLEVTLIDGSRITLAENSRVEVAHYVTDTEPAGLFEVARGRLRAFVTDLFSQRKESFKVKTTTAVVGVQGTDFAVQVQALVSRVLVYEGVVAVANVDFAIPQRQVLSRNQVTTVSKGQPPSPPQPLIGSTVGSGGTLDLQAGGEQGDDPTSATSTAAPPVPLPRTPTPPGR